MATVTLFIPGFRFATDNDLMKKSRHWAYAHKKKAHDRDVVARAVLALAAPGATGKRRVSLRVVMGKGQRQCDRTAFWKSGLDAMVHAGLLVDDSPRWCVTGDVEQVRGGTPGTEITLEDLP